MKPSCFSAVEAAKSLSKENSISLLLAGSGSSLQEAAKTAASCHPSVSKVLQTYGRAVCLKRVSSLEFRVTKFFGVSIVDGCYLFI